MENQHRPEGLFRKFLANQCTEEEVKQLLTHFDLENDEAALKQLIHQYFESHAPADAADDDRVDAALSQVHDELLQRIRNHRKPTMRPGRSWIAAAAMVLMAVGAGIYFYPTPVAPKKQVVVVKPVKQDITPGGNKAILTLADGSRIVLNDADKGVLAQQQGISIRKTDDGQLIYDITAVATLPEARKAEYNTIETPRGGQYQVNLPDGSRVWLNAATKLRFPITFSGNERRVELSGEAYFEIAHNEKMPFHVNADKMDVEVLGTHFNVMAYADEQHATTTLLQGKVKIQANGHEALLKPGQQATLQRSGDGLRVSDADTEHAVAWKNGDFMFAHENIQSIMRKISRWYEVDVQYAPGTQNQDFSGTVSRFKNVSEVLKMLELTGAIHFSIDNQHTNGKERRILVMP